MSYSRAKFFWGALDVVHSDEAPYTPAQTKAMGANALPPGIGVRRAQLVFNRLLFTPAQDAMTTHLDFLNLTNGNPDDTWTDADFTTLETLISTFIQATQANYNGKVVFDSVRWYRVGPGVVPPNPAIRIKVFGFPGTGTNALPPQVGASITFKTVPRRQWGRMYMPWNALPLTSPEGRFSSARVDEVGAAMNSLVTNAIAAEFPPVIYSAVRGKAYTVETVQVDDVPDVIRSRRFNEATHKYVSP